MHSLFPKFATVLTVSSRVLFKIARSPNFFNESQLNFPTIVRHFSRDSLFSSTFRVLLFLFFTEYGEICPACLLFLWWFFSSSTKYGMISPRNILSLFPDIKIFRRLQLPYPTADTLPLYAFFGGIIMELLRQQLIAYRPWNEQEERDREELLRPVLTATRICTPEPIPPPILPLPPGWSARTGSRS